MNKAFLILAMLTFLNGWSQDHHKLFREDNYAENFNVIITHPGITSANGFRNNISIRAVRYFLENFEGATDVKWRIHEKGITVNFLFDDEMVKVNFDKGGFPFQTTRIYTEQKLDPEIIRMVKKETYGDFRIVQVVEVARINETLYEIQLDNEEFICIFRLAKTKSTGLEKFSENLIFRKQEIHASHIDGSQK